MGAFVEGEPVFLSGYGWGVVKWANPAPTGGFQWVGTEIDGKPHGGVHVDADGNDNRGRLTLVRPEMADTQRAVNERVLAAGRHEYEPGEATHPMHTDPLCAVCGAPKGAPVHG